MRRVARLAVCGGAGLAEGLDARGVSRLCVGEQHPAAAEPQRLSFGDRGHRGGQSRAVPVADGFGDAGLHELPLVERHGPQQLHRDIRVERRHDALRGRQTADGGEAAAGAEPHRRPCGRGERQRHPHRHRPSLHAVPLRRRGRHGEPLHGRRLEGPARPCGGDVAGRVDQQGRFRTAGKPVRERRIPGRRGFCVARQLQVAAQAAARTRHNGGDESCGARHPGE